MLNERIIGTPKTTDVQERSATIDGGNLEGQLVTRTPRMEQSEQGGGGVGNAWNSEVFKTAPDARDRKEEERKEGRGARPRRRGAIYFCRPQEGISSVKCSFEMGAMNCRDGDDDGNGRTDGCLRGPLDNNIYRRTLCSKSFHWPLIGCGNPALLRGRDG